MYLTCGFRQLDLTVPKIMGILNATPDSFSDGGSYYSTRDAQGSLSLDLALKRVEKMLDEGASIIDVGGESTRPGAPPVSLEQERERVLPIVEAIGQRFDTIISVDTSSPEIMHEVAGLGAGIPNDVRALQRDGAVQAAAESGLPVCLMHMRGMPRDMQENPHYGDVLDEVKGFLLERVEACGRAGIPRDKLLLDPGFGFGKTESHNLSLLNHLDGLTALGLPVLIGLSRKSMVGRLLDRSLDERLIGSAGFALVAMQNGAKIVRVHDVAATRDMVEIFRLTSRG